MQREKERRAGSRSVLQAEAFRLHNSLRRRSLSLSLARNYEVAHVSTESELLFVVSASRAHSHSAEDLHPGSLQDSRGREIYM